MTRVSRAFNGRERLRIEDAPEALRTVIATGRSGRGATGAVLSALDILSGIMLEATGRSPKMAWSWTDQAFWTASPVPRPDTARSLDVIRRRIDRQLESGPGLYPWKEAGTIGG